jgi:hypothetical protein
VDPTLILPPDDSPYVTPAPPATAGRYHLGPLLGSGGMLPLHDTGRERTLIRQRIAAIARARRTLGRAAEGPADYAIGRGELALGDYAASPPAPGQELC